MYYAIMLFIFFAEQQQIYKNKPTELSVLQQFYQDLQNGILINEFLPALITKRVISISDKTLITESGKNSNERCQFFLDQYISKPLSAGDPSAFYKLLQLLDASSKHAVLTAKIKQCLMIESLQDKISGTYVYVIITNHVQHSKKFVFKLLLPAK